MAVGHDVLHREMYILIARLDRAERDMRNVSAALRDHLDRCGSLGSTTADLEAGRAGLRSVPINSEE